MVPIAAITSHTNSHRRCYDAGMDIMLPKPIKHEMVMKILRSTVNDFCEAGTESTSTSTFTFASTHTPQ